jgi:hypothetical protein
MRIASWIVDLADRILKRWEARLQRNRIDKDLQF